MMLSKKIDSDFEYTNAVAEVNTVTSASMLEDGFVSAAKPVTLDMLEAALALYDDSGIDNLQDSIVDLPAVDAVTI